MLKSLRIYTLLVAVAVIAGETAVVVLRDKYLPLALDDYLAAGLLLVFVRTAQTPAGLPPLIAVWAAMVGNIYATLFGRLDPVHGSGERIGLLVVLLGALTVGLCWSVRLWLTDRRSD